LLTSYVAVVIGHLSAQKVKGQGHQMMNVKIFSIMIYLKLMFTYGWWIACWHMLGGFAHCILVAVLWMQNTKHRSF